MTKNAKEDNTIQNTTSEVKSTFTRKKLPAHFVDEVSNISIAPNGACRLHFNTWSNGEEDQPVRIDTELIMTINSLKSLADALPKALAQAESAVGSKEALPSTKMN